MGLNVTQKLGRPHLVEEVMLPGREIGIQIDQTLTQDATSTLVMLELEAMGLDRVSTEVSVQYVDRNPIQEDSKNPDDHLFLRSACRRFDVWFSPTGNGVSHPVHQERFGKPGKTLLGSDSHTGRRSNRYAGDGRRRTRSGACDGRTALSCQDTESVGRHLQDRSRTELARKT
jgi:aconitate hydratase